MLNVNISIDPENKGKENYLNYYDFNSIYSSAMFQRLPTGEMIECNENSFTPFIYNTGYIYTIYIKYTEELKI